MLPLLLGCSRSSIPDSISSNPAQAGLELQQLQAAHAAGPRLRASKRACRTAGRKEFAKKKGWLGRAVRQQRKLQDRLGRIREQYGGSSAAVDCASAKQRPPRPGATAG